MLNRDQIQDFDRDGFVVAPGLFDAQESAILLARAQERIRESIHDMPDADGRSSKLNLWMDLRPDVFTSVITHPRMLSSIRALMREDCYHWHSKVMLKEPRCGGAWEWHQDYGYWYFDGCPYPRLISCLVALDRTDRANGCLKVIPGSHSLGRLEHGQVGSQLGANAERVGAVLKHLPVRYLEVEPGSAVFFHCNTLHASEANTSDRARTSYICCYNAMSNVPIAGVGHGKPVPLTMSAEEGITAIGMPMAAMAP